MQEIVVNSEKHLVKYSKWHWLLFLIFHSKMQI